MRSFNLIGAGLLLLALTGALKADSTSPYPYVKALAAPEAPGKAIGAFALDEDLFAATDDSYANLRVFDDRGVEIPSLVRCRTQKKTVVAEHAVAINTLAFERLPDNRIEIIIGTNEAGRAIRAVAFHSRLRDFEKLVTVSGSPDRQAWQRLATDQPIFDYSKFIDLRNSRVDIGPGSFAFYKIEISNITESQQSPLVQIVRETRDGALAGEEEKTSFTKEDFRIDKIDFMTPTESITESDRVTRPYAIQNLAVTNDAAAKTTVIAFDTPRVPLTALILLTPTVNFSRALTVEGRNDDDHRGETVDGAPDWRPLASATLSRIDIGKFQQDSTVVSFNGAQRFRHYRLTLHNLDNPPLNVTGIGATGEVHEALFFCEPSRNYRVFYGAREMTTPRYDIATVLEKTKGADTATFSAAKQEPNAAYQHERRPAFSGRRLLIPTVILMVITLVWVIARAARRMAI